MRRILLIALTTASVAACSSVEAPTTEPQAPPNYRKLIASQIRSRFAPGSTIGTDAQISPLRRNKALYVADWNACLKVEVKGQPQIYTVFITNNAIIHFRLSVSADDCESVSWEPLKLT
jgi:hypothetical protein